MLPAIRLIGFGMRQVIGMVPEAQAKEALGNVAGPIIRLVVQHFTDHSTTLPKALARANDRAWQAVSIALAGDGFLDQIKVFFASGDNKGIREQVRLFLQDKNIGFESGSPADFRKKCLAELNRVKKAGLLKAQDLSPKNVAEQTSSFQRYGDPKGMVDGAERVIGQIADELAPVYPNLAKLLRQSPPGGPPLLVSAFSYFFRREVETDVQLAHGLFFDGLRQLSATQDKAFGEVGKALSSLGDQFEQVFEQLDRIESVVAETHGAVLDMQAELQRLANLPDELRRLSKEVQKRVSQALMQNGEVKPHQSFSIRSQDERDAVRQMLARFRQLPPQQQKKVPALLNGLGKLQFGSGDFQGARQTFLEVADEIHDPAAQAEAHFNAYRAALEEKKWAVALDEIQRAASLDSQRFAPFPMERYQAKNILGAGGFGTAFLCHDRFFNADVVVKTLHDDGMERKMAEVFREAQLLGQLHHPAIIGVKDCSYSDVARLARPYIAMEFFNAGNLETYIHRFGTLSPRDMLIVARQIAEGMVAAHRQGILHRDIKPDNVLVRKSGDGWQVKIIDFGLALRKQTIETSMAARGAAGSTILNESVAGTIKYAPPEQMGEMKGVDPGPYSDVYSFGKLCCYALFKTTEPKSRHWTSIPKELHEILEKCTEQELQHRPKSFELVLKVLQALDPIRKQFEGLQQEGEAKLVQFIREAFDRTQGKPSPADATAANEICKQHRIAKDRAKKIVAEVKGQWQNAHSVKAEQKPGEIDKVARPANRPDLPAVDPYSDIRQIEQEFLKAHEIGNEDVFLFERVRSRLARWKDAAEKGLGCAQFLYGQCFLNGTGVAKDDGQAMTWVRKAAEQGHSHAQVVLGAMYEDGRGVPQDDVEAVAWFRKAAEQENSNGQAALGSMYENGSGVPRDSVVAAAWLRKAAEQGNCAAQLVLGAMYSDGRGVPQDDAHAIAWLRKAADQGNLWGLYLLGLIFQKAQDNGQAEEWFRKTATLASSQAGTSALVVLGMLYQNGFGVPKDDVQAAACYSKAAARRDSHAQYALGVMYAEGHCVPHDDLEAVAWIRKAAEQGNCDAQNYLGWMYEKGRGVSRDDAQAVAWYRKAAAHGNSGAQRNLGSMFQGGRGVRKDEVQAGAWYRKAAEQGNSDAQFSVGWMHQDGCGVAQDEEQAVAWFRKAAAQGHILAQFFLGSAFQEGRGVRQDDVQAAAWYRKAAEQGNSDAQVNIGWMYGNGRGVPQDETLAVAWYRKAADQGNMWGLYNLGLIYEEGRGCFKKDLRQAMDWYRKAADQGHDEALKRLKALKTPGEIITNSLGMKFAWIPPGTFLMGSPKMEEVKDPHKPNEMQHKVTLTKGFYMAIHPVTCGQFAAFVERSNYKTQAETEGGAHIWTGKEWVLDATRDWRSFDQTNHHPVVCVSWNDGAAFAKWLAATERKNYRLPTEAEWEYACRADTTTPFHFGETISTDQANYNGNFAYGNGKKGVWRQQTTSVDSFPANAWGLQDMHGNVWEWCLDWYGGNYLQYDEVDPQGPSSSLLRGFVARGGSWINGPQYCRSACRNGFPPGFRGFVCGFRLCFCVD